jgi:hypothetical protein
LPRLLPAPTARPPCHSSPKTLPPSKPPLTPPAIECGITCPNVTRNGVGRSSACCPWRACGGVLALGLGYSAGCEENWRFEIGDLKGRAAGRIAVFQERYALAIWGTR